MELPMPIEDILQQDRLKTREINLLVTENRKLRSDLARLRLSVDPEVMEDIAGTCDWKLAEQLRNLAARQRAAIAEMEKPL